MPIAPFLALITPVTGGNEQPPYPSQGPGFPTNPIAGPGRPPWWGMANDPGYSPPWAQPQPPRPWGPIHYPDQGLPGNQPYPDNTLPGQPPRPWGPSHYPDQGLPGPPLYLWGPNDPRPTPPIVIPPDLPDTIPPAQGSGGEPVPVTWKTGWSQSTGWVIVGVPTGPVPTPA